MKKIAHLTSVHQRYDTRIFVKMCSSIARAGYATSLVVADGKGSERKNLVDIVDVGAPTGGRLSRMFGTTNRVLAKALELNADIYHLHDPELMPIGLKLKRRNKIVIFDAHEDFPKQVYAKPYLGKVSKAVLPKVAHRYEQYACKRFDAVVAATPDIRDKFLTYKPEAVDIANYPLLEELQSVASWEDKGNEIAYIGGISQLRGIRELIEALGRCEGAQLNLAGKFIEPDVERDMREHRAWAQVTDHGFVDREGVAAILARSRIGMVTLRPAPNHVRSLPVKMFEYMSAGLPVIASNFPLWKSIIDKHQCGLCVDPMDEAAIASGIQSLLANSDEAKAMGARGRQAVEQLYNWSIENEKLMSLYRGLLE